MEARFILSFLIAIFISGNNMQATEQINEVDLRLPIILKGEVPTITTTRSALQIPIYAFLSTDDKTVDITFTAPIGEVKILVDGHEIETCQVSVVGQTTSFSINGWAPGVYKLEFITASGGYVYGEFVIE